MTQHVYFFGDGNADGDRSMKNTLGGKGANLAEMIKVGLPVPAGFTLTTEVCVYYSKNNGKYPDGCEKQVEEALARTEQVMGKKLGDPANPLLLSCRSGARESMPGMMDTVLNIGLNDETVEGLAKLSGNPRFAYDSYRRLLQMYGDVVMDLDIDERADDPFEVAIHEQKEKSGVTEDVDLTADDLKAIVQAFKDIIKDRNKGEGGFPQDAKEQVWQAIAAVFKSWDNDRAKVYRRMNNIPHEWGTACNVMAMVFGNMGDECATGVALTRDGSFGQPGVNGDYLINAQGEDVVAGSRATKRIETELGKDMPAAHKELLEVCDKLEKHYRDMQDIEFTIESNKLWLLQTRNAKRTGFAAVRVAHDLVEEGLIDKKEALSTKRIPADGLNQLLQPVFDAEDQKKAKADKRLLTTGIAAGPGAAMGQIVFHAADAEEMYNKDHDVDLLLVRTETSPEDLRGMKVANGILTKLGGTSSHAALVSRQMGKVCVVGAKEISISYKDETLTVGDKTFKQGDYLSIDGFTGDVFEGKIETRPSEVVSVLINQTKKPEDSEDYQRFAKILSWADEIRKLGVRTNADKPEQAKAAIALGAEGIGLCRTEHMFFDHVLPVRLMILATTKEARASALAQLLPTQREDFYGLFKAMAGKPVTIRLLDPPLHEFLSERHLEEDPKLLPSLAKETGLEEAVVRARIEQLHENNPMLGFRGCRLGNVYPEITEMQSRAIFEAACKLKKEGVDVQPEVMIPLIGFRKELEAQVKIVREVAAKVFEEQGIEVAYLAGTMIEIPRAALTADEVAEVAEFFSFGTNDLTQTTLGMSRDDYGPFIGQYQELDLIPADPFATLDPDGVGQLVKMGTEKGRSTNAKLKVGICGEHGGDPASVMFCHGAGLDYVSCSPYRVPVARLAAAQAVLEG